MIASSSEGGVTLTVTVPPGSPAIEPDRDLEQRVADLEALIEEARRRARLRRRIYAALVLAGLGAGAWAAFGIGGDGGGSVVRSGAGGPPRALAAQTSPGGWQALHGPEGGYLFSIAIDPADSRIVYAGGWGTVFKSVDGGGSWKGVSNEPWTRVGVIAIDPSQPAVVYAGTDRGVAKTADGGRHWRMVNAGLFDGRAALRPRAAALDESAIGSLTIDARHPSTVYATTALGLYRTTNGGKRWQIIGPAFFRHVFCSQCAVLRSGYELAVAIDPNHAQTVYASWTQGAASAKLYKSADGGTSWRQIAMSDAFSFHALVLTASGALLGADLSRPGVYRSTDGGATWKPAGAPAKTFYGLSVDPGSGTIYAQASGATFQTTDGGDSWQRTPPDLTNAEIVTAPSDPATAYAGSLTNGASLLKSVDRGHTWAAADRGILSTVISSLAFVPGAPATLYGANLGPPEVVKSIDSGRTWHPASAGLGGAYVSTFAVEPRRPSTIFAATQSSGLFKTTDGGRRWRRVPIGFPAKADVRVAAVAADPQQPETVYAAACPGIECVGPGAFLKTVDGGATWRKITGLPRLAEAIAIDPRRTSTVFAGTAQGGLFRSRDGGSSWQWVARVPGVRRPKAYVADPWTVVAIAIDPLHPDTVYAGSRTGGILKSTDGGTTWAAANTGLTDKHISTLIIDPRDTDVLFTSTAGGVFRTGNGGETWQADNGGVPAGGVAAFAIDPARHTIFAGTNGGGVVSHRLGD
jgi:photosystem II stability/assembly factor-like uncharacterized protein